MLSRLPGNPKNSFTAYAADPDRIGIASTPVPIRPMAKREEAKGPATGFSAVAAWAALWMSVLPWALSTAAPVRMMAYITTWEKNIPTRTSNRAALISSLPTPRRLASVTWPAARIASTSEDACQKKRYGEIVVPSTATRAMT